jgi:Phosphoesterase family
VRDRFGPGTRVPAILVSPIVKRGFVDHTLYDTTSILKLIEICSGLALLTEADARADRMLNALQFRGRDRHVSEVVGIREASASPSARSLGLRSDLPARLLPIRRAKLAFEDLA